MIITRTPFRVTLGGGGTDLPSYYEKNGGFIFAMGINHYMYLTLHQSCVDRRVVLQYSKTEVVDQVKDVQHELALRCQGERGGPQVRGVPGKLPGNSPRSAGFPTTGPATEQERHPTRSYEQAARPLSTTP